MISCDDVGRLQERAPGPQRWWEEYCPSQQRGLIIRRPTRMLNLDVQVRYGPIAYPRIYPRVGSMGRSIDLEDKAAKVADLRRVRRARERSRARPLAV